MIGGGGVRAGWKAGVKERRNRAYGEKEGDGKEEEEWMMKKKMTTEEEEGGEEMGFGE